jgi:MFS family permease
LKSNPDFAAFEKNFSIYGLGFLMVIPVIPILLVERLHMNYTNTFIAKGILSQVGILLFSPLFGKLHDHKDIFQFGSLVFGILAIYQFGFVLATLSSSVIFASIIVLISYLIYGIAMSGVNVTWTMGSIYFAGDEDASMFQSVHITLTGIRGLIAPLFGFAIYRVFGLTAVFLVACFCEIYVSRLSYLRYKKRTSELLG